VQLELLLVQLQELVQLELLLAQLQELVLVQQQEQLALPLLELQ
jgi:hypothetical protein